MNPIYVDIKRVYLLCLHRQTQLTLSGFGGPSVTLAAIKQLGYMQLDTLTELAGAHEHTLWNRLSAFWPRHIEKCSLKPSVLTIGPMPLGCWLKVCVCLPKFS